MQDVIDPGVEVHGQVVTALSNDCVGGLAGEGTVRATLLTNDVGLLRMLGLICRYNVLYMLCTPELLQTV